MTGDTPEAPLVSVVIPTYQRRAAVLRAVESAQAQWLEDHEIVVVDDGSDDGTQEALAGRGDLRYLRQPNRGVSAARNAGLAVARGRHVAFLDSDNRWLPDHLTTVVDALERHPDAALAFSLATDHPGPPARARGTEASDPLPRLLVGNYVACLSAVVVRRSAVLAAGGFDERLGFAEDADLWLRIALGGGLFARVPRRTVVRGSSGDSLVRGRARGQYVRALELSTRRALERTLHERGRGEMVGAWLSGRLHLVRALAVLEEGDRSAFARELRQALHLLPELASHPRSVVVHVWFTLTGEDGPGERLRRLAALCAAWPRVGGARRRELVVSSLRAVLGLHGPRRRPAALGAQRAVLRSERGPLRPAWALAHEVLARGAAWYLRRGDDGVSAYVRGSLASGEPVYGLSDIDLALVTGHGPREAEVRRSVALRWLRLTRRLPALSGTLFDTPQVYGEEELAGLVAATTFTHEVDDDPPRPSSRERVRERAGAERTRLYGVTNGWRLLGGPERRPPAQSPDAHARRLTSWLELQFWWLQAFRACTEASAPWVPHLCVKLMTEPARVWLWLVHGEALSGRRALIERASAAIPSERATFAQALALAGSLDRGAPAPLEDAVGELLRMSQMIGERIDADAAGAGATGVRLLGDGPDGLVLPPAPLAALQRCVPAAADPLPLVDWRARVWSLLPDECLVPVGDAAAADPRTIGPAALCGNDGAYAGLQLGGLLVVPSLKRSRLRAVQCAATDPVSFALVNGAARASFPDLPGWSARDSAHRAVAEHLGWLCSPARSEPVEEAGRLLGAARAALFLESVDAGDPELLLTTGAVAQRLGPAGEEAHGAYRRARVEGGPIEPHEVSPLRRAVEELGPYRQRAGAPPRFQPSGPPLF